MWYDKMKKVKRSRFRFYDSTISVADFTIVKPAWSLKGSSVSSLNWIPMGYGDGESFWLSSITVLSDFQRRAAFVGYNGAIDESWTSEYRQDLGIAFQRPALYIFDNYNRDYNST
jgi:hypothetical protein